MSKSPAFDPQRQEVYRMEKQGLFGLNRARYSRADLRKLMQMACKQFELPPPLLRYKAAKSWAGVYQCVDVPVITMSTVYVGGLSAMTLLHELAHYVVHMADPNDVLEPHGPEFVGVYGDLMECMGFMPFGSWHLLTAQHKIRCFDTGYMRPPQLLKALKKRAAEAAPKSPPKR